MQEYDVIIIGAGPSGGQCARELAKKGNKILLVEKAKDFSVNNFSSGGAPLEILKDYNLPTDIVASFLNRFSISSSKDQALWNSTKMIGVILDFQKLREFLANETIRYGGALLLDKSYRSHESFESNKIIVHLQDHESHQIHPYLTKVLVDATGVERKVLMGETYNKKKNVAATGMEYLIETSPQNYLKFAQTLSFLFGHKWMPQGYAWVFPMQPNLLKVGIIRYFAHEDIVPHESSYHFYMDNLLNETLGSKDTQILDRHGKTLYYTYKQHDLRYHQNVLAIGDSISMLNPMACEGIRHAMASGKFAAENIHDYLHGKKDNFKSYSNEISRYCGTKWNLSEFIMDRLYKEQNDFNIELILQVFKTLSLDDILDFGFGYQFSKVLKFSSRYASLLIKHKLKEVFS